MKKRGFQFLKTRPLDDKIDIDSLEKKLGLKFPVKYRIFLETFYMGEEAMIKEKYLNKFNYFSECSGYLYAPEDYIGFNHFIPTDLACSVYFEYEIDSYERENKFFPIGATGTSAIIFVGCSSDNYDKIYFEHESNWRLLCNDIFEFVRCLESWPHEKDLSNGTYSHPYTKLYRNWTEDFWRIRDEEQ